MILRNLLLSSPQTPVPTPTAAEPKVAERFYGGRSRSTMTKAKQTVTPESAMGVAAAYRAVNIISDDFAKIPLQLFRKRDGKVEQVPVDARLRNVPYLLQRSPNRWGWTPFRHKKVAMQWELHYGNSYIWSPPVWPFEQFILPADVTYPVFDTDGNLWYCTTFRSAKGKPSYIPGVEVHHSLINPDETGQVGRGVIQFARETIGRQLGAYETESQMYARGMNPQAYIQMAGELSNEARKKVQQAYGEAIFGVDSYGLAVMDQKVLEFKPITMPLADQEFLGQIAATNIDIANYYGLPQHMLNMGKEAYNSNDERFVEYLFGTLDAYLVPFEQAANIRWIPEADQGDHEFKFIRESILRMTPEKRAAMNEVLIRSAQRSPKETREKDDCAPYPGSEKFYMMNGFIEVGANQVPPAGGN